MSSHALNYISPEEYLERERAADTKHEYVHGEMVAMAGGSPRHAMVIANVTGALWTRLQAGGCTAFSSDLRIAVRWGELIAYPDVSVVCGDLQYVDDRRDTVTNPRVIVEVLSPSTKNFDRGEKSRLFRLMPSIAEFLLIEQEPVEIEHYRKQPNGDWLLTTIRDRDAMIRLESLGCELPVADIYRGVESVPA